MISINMRSSANAIKSQGVCSCYEEQVTLIKSNANEKFYVTENKSGYSDIVHYHTVNLEYFIERMLNRKKTAGIGYVHFLPNTLDESLRLPKLFRAIFYKYLLSFYNSMDYLVTVNPYFIGEIKAYGITHPEVICIPNFVSEKMFYPLSERENRKTKANLGIPEDKFVVISVGQLQTRKGVFDFVETAKRLPDVEFIWAGGFSFGKISEGYDEIKKLMISKPENVRFLGIVDREEMPYLYNIADIMFLPSHDELFPMAVLEALCCKKPVLVRDIPLYDKILFDYCMRGRDADEFAALILKIEKDASEYDLWCKKAWECHQLYSEEKALEQWENLYINAFAGLKERKENDKRKGWLKAWLQRI